MYILPSKMWSEPGRVGDGKSLIFGMTTMSYDIIRMIHIDFVCGAGDSQWGGE